MKNFSDSLSGLDLSKWVHVSMDGPNMNQKFLKEIKQERESAKVSRLMVMDSCNLHSIHSA